MTKKDKKDKKASARVREAKAQPAAAVDPGALQALQRGCVDAQPEVGLHALEQPLPMRQFLVPVPGV